MQIYSFENSNIITTYLFNYYLQFHWQFLIILANILLWKFDTLSRKEMKIIKNKSFDEKQEKNAKKINKNRK